MPSPIHSISRASKHLHETKRVPQSQAAAPLESSSSMATTDCVGPFLMIHPKLSQFSLLDRALNSFNGQAWDSGGFAARRNTRPPTTTPGHSAQNAGVGRTRNDHAKATGRILGRTLQVLRASTHHGPRWKLAVRRSLVSSNADREQSIIRGGSIRSEPARHSLALDLIAPADPGNMPCTKSPTGKPKGSICEKV
jgi:hypothetical protein